MPGETAIEHNLPLINSASAPLSESLYNEVSHHFGAPVIEIYGMSETCGVITSNPTDPGEQKVGSVGKAANCELTIQNDCEVWVRTAGLFRGYQDEKENEGLWKDGAFFTADLGYLDEDRYLFLTRRAKEQIKRGGQKVAPREINQTVEAWPEIVEAASFGFPHATLGEDVGLALVLKESQSVDDPYAYYEEFHTCAPFYQTADGAWVISHYRDNKTALDHPSLGNTSSQFSTLAQEKSDR